MFKGRRQREQEAEQHERLMALLEEKTDNARFDRIEGRLDRLEFNVNRILNEDRAALAAELQKAGQEIGRLRAELREARGPGTTETAAEQEPNQQRDESDLGPPGDGKVAGGAEVHDAGHAEQGPETVPAPMERIQRPPAPHPLPDPTDREKPDPPPA